MKMSKIVPLSDFSTISYNNPSASEIELVNNPECRICCDSDVIDSLISPCQCTGTLKHTHKKCLILWILSQHKRNKGKYSLKQSAHCQICHQKYPIRIIQEKKINCRKMDVEEKVCEDLVKFVAALIIIAASLCLIVFLMVVAIRTKSWPYAIAIVLALVVGVYLTYFLITKFFVEVFEELDFDQELVKSK